MDIGEKIAQERRVGELDDLHAMTMLKLNRARRAIISTPQGNVRVFPTDRARKEYREALQDYTVLAMQLWDEMTAPGDG